MRFKVKIIPFIYGAWGHSLWQLTFVLATEKHRGIEDSP